ncbi:ATP10 protein-domain-containing protein [Jimgerdemannia flammicorona]|uniref:ATP10 protein-domain-containing protein n=1 Tax=Jimgerdemannia flammicorona TaxID=994334 RepID=A0A433QQV1_9FUNG|nr:ATP10 protein-domain-containing protein [Jimgerdemannia flammicorona]
MPLHRGRPVRLVSSTKDPPQAQPQQQQQQQPQPSQPQQQPQPATPRKRPMPTTPLVFGVPEPPVVGETGGIGNIIKNLDYERVAAANAEERKYLCVLRNGNDGNGENGMDAMLADSNAFGYGCDRTEKFSESYWKDMQGSEFVLEFMDEANLASPLDIHIHGGKMWEASTKLIKKDKANYMPNFRGVDLYNNQVNTTDRLHGKTSLMAFVFARFGEPHAASFVDPFLEVYGGQKNIQLIEVRFEVRAVMMNVQENKLKSLILRAFVPSIRKNTAEARRANYILLYQNIERLRKPLGMYNQYLGYVFLVDSECRIRWAAHGLATLPEVKTMLAAVRALHDKNSVREVDAEEARAN